MRKTIRFLALAILPLVGGNGGAAFAQQDAPSRPMSLQLPAFTAIEAHNGTHVVFAVGATRRVTVVRGGLEYSRVTVEGGRLVIDRCARKCPRGYRLDIEIVAPAPTNVFLSNGGTIQSRGSFPRQADLTVAVDNGGTIDVRSMSADRVTASVNQGGGILTAPQASLSARISHGGAVTYWGNARVQSSVDHGGVVQRGAAGRITRQL